MRERTEGDFHACNYSIETWEGRGVKLCNIIHLITSFMANSHTHEDILAFARTKLFLTVLPNRPWPNMNMNMNSYDVICTERGLKQG